MANTQNEQQPDINSVAIVSEIIGLLDDETHAKAMEIIVKHTGAKTPLKPFHTDGWLKALTDYEASTQKRHDSRRSLIKRIFMREGFTIKEGQTDLKEYVYAAGNRLIDEVERHFRKVGAILVFLSRKPTQQEIEHYGAIEDRSKWSLVEWAEHLGAREDDQHNVVFGSWYALGQMIELRDKEVERQAFQAARKEGLV